jgi:hypothetical protein
LRNYANITGGLRLLALVPHRDVQRSVRIWSGGLFAAGLAGAWAFPWVVPLALLSRPLSPAELRDAACALREANRGGDGMLRSLGAGLLPLGGAVPGASGGGDGPAVYGLALDMVVPGLAGSAAGALIRPLEPPVLGAALLDGPEAAPPDTAPPDTLPPPPELAFRAAALANMIYRARPAEEGAVLYEWKTGRPRWLPPIRSARGGGGPA